MKKMEVYRTEQKQMVNAVERIAAVLCNMQEGTKGGRSIAFTGISNKAGTTALCYNLAVVLADSGKNVLLVDADLRKANDRKCHRTENNDPGLSEYLCNERLDVNDVLYDSGISRLTLVPGGESGKNALLVLGSERLDQFIRETKECFDYIIYDLPAVGTVADGEVVIPKLDSFALVAAESATRIKQIRAVKTRLANQGRRYLGTVCNRMRRHSYKAVTGDVAYYERRAK